MQHSLSAQMSNLGITGFLVVDLGEARGWTLLFPADWHRGVEFHFAFSKTWM